jgi:hypothetical protein
MRTLVGAALVSALMPLTAVAAEPAVHTETIPAGPYTIELQFANYPAFAGRPLRFKAHVSRATELAATGVSLSAEAQPGQGTVATPVQAQIDGARSGFDFQGRVAIPVRGIWGLRFHLEGAGVVEEPVLPLLVGAPGAIPTWLGWMIGLAPLLGVAAFGVWQARELRRLLRLVPV